ncbi:PPP family 3-phenylpropionic acid transporter [Pseudoxanthomonas sp. 3HH-4]|uniref:MFS transporter n=1 Tax=Pseudoxanthomonas sp. 3HH-4 TaxID=1690214 RepID=UPI001151A396|nr:MFS transporter [Pseudoxanthomonas sp. 3HH-4]TQM10578.1 PPP family 3-phenylpropionic acid transporter [Pseudoxanthomonas sp. 3HH-4]
MRDAIPTTAYPAARLSSFYFSYYAVLGAFTPYWSLYLESRGLSVAAISVLMSLWYATRIVSPSLWTTLAARSPNPIRWLHLGCALALGCFALFLLPLEHAGLFAVMLGFCFAYNAVMPQFESITMSHLGTRSDRYGLIRVWGSIGFILVVSLFGWLIDVRRLGVGALPWLMLPVLTGVFASALSNRYAREPEHHPVDQQDGFRARLRRPQVIAFFVAAFLTQISFGPFYTFFSIYLSEHGYATATQGVLWTVGVLAEIGVFFLASRIFRRWDASRVLMVALFSASVRWLATALFPDNTPVMVLAQLTHALNFGAFFAAAMQLLVRFFPGRMNGHGQGVFYGLSSGVGGVAGALLAGQLWRFGGETAFLASSVIALIAAFIVWNWLIRPGTSTAQLGDD